MSDSKLPENDPPHEPRATHSRRDFLRSGVAGAGVIAGVGLNLMEPQSAMAESPSSPEQALHTLMEGNRHFVSAELTNYNHDLKNLRRELATKQEPFAAVLSCADSRGPMGMVFDQTIGRLFICRVAGNMITPEIIASLEYGVAVLGTKVILVLGHSDCGAVKAAIAHKTVPGQISALYPHLQPAVETAGPDVKAVTEANAKIQAKLLSESSTIISAAIKENKLKVVAGYYDIGSGAVTILD